MTDYAPMAASDPSWTWWMTTAAAAAVRLRNIRDRHGGGGESDDDFAAGSDCKKRKHGAADREECWAAYDDVADGAGWRTTAEPGPLDLSVKACTLTAATTKTAAVDRDRDAGTDRRVVVNEYKVQQLQSTPVKKTHPTCATGKSSKKTSAAGAKVGGGGGGGTAPAAAVKAATRKLLPQLLLDHRHVDRSSPVSGTIIVPATSEDRRTASRRSSPSPTARTDCGSGAAADGDQDEDYDGGDIDPEFNVVVATEEARRRLESIPNALGPYLCRLCGVRYADAFALARHRCRCIVHVRYSCPECDKVFQCPANLASHRRWHGTGGSAVKTSSGGNSRAKNVERLQKPEAAVHEIIAGPTNNNNNNNNNDDDDGDKKEIVRRDVATAVSSTLTTVAAAGFKKNILQRAVQAATAAAANNNNNNDDDDDDDDDHDVCFVRDAS